MLPPACLVTVRIPDAETTLTPREGEIVVFEEHFYKGFGLSASTFFSNWLIFFGLQPHHLAPNAILQMYAFVVLCEGFLGIEPRRDLWQTLFFFKQQSKKMGKAELEKLDGPRPMTPCGAALVHHRSKSGFPQMPLQESIKQWRKGFFYVKNVSPAHDALNMPPFNINPPMEKLNWEAKYPKPIPKVVHIGAYPDSLKDHGLWGRDLLTTMVSRRILPLQRRPHLVCQMSGQYDPCRTTTKSFTVSVVVRGVNQISTAHMDDGGNWEWGLAPYDKSPVGTQPACPDVVTSDASEIKDEGMIEARFAAFEDSGDVLESEGVEPSGEHLKPSIVDWTDDDETPSSLSNAAFEENSDRVEEVTNPPLTHRRCHKAEAASLGEAARRKGKGAKASWPAPKRAATGPPARARAGGAKKRCAGAGRRQVPIAAGEEEDVEEDTASAAERAGWDVAAEKMVEGQSVPSRAEKPADSRTKARHDPSTRARMEEPAREAAPRHVRRTEAAKPSKPDTSALVDLNEIPESPEAEVAANAPELNLDAPDVALDPPELLLD
ncbi:hypothetical protein D1007_39504 [Hordeum vulgare]|nr:hypothetical protein D1007_39504 [Hordeum vulgare]